MVEVKRTVRIPIYGGKIIIVISDEDDVYESTKRHFKVIDNSLKSFVAVSLQSDSNYLYPVLLSGKITPGLVAHEAKHIVNRLYTDIGIILDRENDETETYLLSWVVNRIWEVYVKFLKLK